MIDSSFVYDAIDEVYTVPSVQDLVDYCRKWEEDPGYQYFDREEVQHDER